LDLFIFPLLDQASHTQQRVRVIVVTSSSAGFTLTLVQFQPSKQEHLRAIGRSLIIRCFPCFLETSLQVRTFSAVTVSHTKKSKQGKLLQLPSQNESSAGTFLSTRNHDDESSYPFLLYALHAPQTTTALPECAACMRPASHGGQSQSQYNGVAWTRISRAFRNRATRLAVPYSTYWAATKRIILARCVALRCDRLRNRVVPYVTGQAVTLPGADVGSYVHSKAHDLQITRRSTALGGSRGGGIVNHPDQGR
jgi:hypothetical protein